MNSFTLYSSAFPTPSGFSGTFQSYAELQARRSISESQRKDMTIFTKIKAIK